MTIETIGATVQKSIEAAQSSIGLNIIAPPVWQDQPVPERKWLIPGWIPMGCVTSLYGDGGAGKSLLSMQLITAAAIGRHWLGCNASPVKAFGFFCEDDMEELQRRQTSINKLYGIDMADLENARYASGVGMNNILMTFDDDQTGNPTGLYYAIEHQAIAFGAQLIVIDTAADTFGGDENKRPQVRRFINQLTALALKINGAVVLCAHPSVAGLTSGRGDGGSTAWNNSVRSRLYFTVPGNGEENDDARVLSRKKANYAARNDEIKVIWKEGVFIPQSCAPFNAADGARRQAIEKAAEDVFLNLLDKYEAQGRPLSAKKNASNFAPKMMMESPSRQGLNKKDLKDAMERLFHRGVIRNESYGRPSNPSNKIVKTKV